MATSPTRRWKGCPVCHPHKRHGAPQAHRKTWQELRKLGKVRRVARHDLGD